MISNEINLVDIAGIKIVNDRSQKDFAALNDTNYKGLEQDKKGYPFKK